MKHRIVDKDGNVIATFETSIKQSWKPWKAVEIKTDVWSDNAKGYHIEEVSA